MTIDMCAMELKLKVDNPSGRQKLLHSRSSAPSNNELSDVFVIQTSSDVSISPEPVVKKKSAYFNIGSISSSPSHSPSHSSKSLKKDSKIKKDSYQEQKRKELLKLVKKDNTQDIMCMLRPDVNVSDRHGRTLLIIAIQNRNDTIINELLAQKDIDLNKSDEAGDTPLHHAVLQNHYALIKILLYDPRINSLLRNQGNLFAHQLIDNQFPQELLELRSLFFVRSRLELVVDEVIPVLLKKPKNTHDDLSDIIVLIQERIKDDGKKQKDHQPLPEKMQLPTDDIFIKQMIMCRLAKQDVGTLQNTAVRSNVLTRSTEILSSVKKDI